MDEETVDLTPPGVVSRIAHSRQAHDSLPRFWGEVVQPRQAGAAGGPPDPLTASGLVPAGASALQPEACAASLPALDPEACTGCGRCWSACPDSAIGVTALSAEALLTAASHGRRHRKAASRTRCAAPTNTWPADSPVGWPRPTLNASTRPPVERLGSGFPGSLGISDQEREGYEAAFDATLERVMRIEPVVTNAFLHEPERQTKGSGELLVLAVDPRACLGCGLCTAVCPEDALRDVAADGVDYPAARQRWRDWEALPDTSGESLARAAERPEIGPMAALLLSRHCAQAQLGAGEGEPASGERLAGRWLAASAEQHGQRRTSSLLRTLEERRAALEETAREGLAAGLSAADLGTLQEAIGGVASGRADLSALGERLDALGNRATIDRTAVLRRLRLIEELDRIRDRHAQGQDGLGRARFGVVVARGRSRRMDCWRYPPIPTMPR